MALYAPPTESYIVDLMGVDEPARPTLNVLRSLIARETGWGRERHREFLRETEHLAWPSLHSLDHVIIRAAASTFPHGRATNAKPHQSSTKSAQRRVWEVIDGSLGWRGAVILDDHGDPWLVHVDSHEAFHNHAATHLTAANAPRYMPTEADYHQRDLERGKVLVSQWRDNFIRAALDGLHRAVEIAGPTRLVMPPPPDGSRVGELTIEVSGDLDGIEQVTVGNAHDSLADITLTVRIRPVDWNATSQVIGYLVPIFGSNLTKIDPVYAPDGDLVITFMTTHADLAKLLAVADVGPVDTELYESIEITHSHYVDRIASTAAYVDGRVLRAICGLYFTPSQNPEHLPICAECEHHRPVAENLLQVRKALVQRTN